MSERKVINLITFCFARVVSAARANILCNTQKYFPPDFDPSKIKRRKLGKQLQQPVRLMAPFSMRCNRCGEYVYKGKKFNARKETAEGEEYYGIKVFRFYIKCPTCSSEITFKTDPKNADYICEQGATRNFENWSDAVDPTGRTKALPGAEDDDDYDSDGNLKEESKERSAMEDLERAQEQSRREMEMMDELSDLRQRNARLELSNANADPEALLAALHAEKESAEQERKRKQEEAEDEAELAKYFSHVRNKITEDKNEVGKGKGKARAEEDADGADGAEDNGSDGSASDGEGEGGLLDLTIKRRPPPGTGGAGEPTVASLLAAKGKVLDPSIGAAVASPGMTNGAAAPQLVKRKREGMQKLLGIKKKAKA